MISLVDLCINRVLESRLSHENIIPVELSVIINALTEFNELIEMFRMTIYGGDYMAGRPIDSCDIIQELRELHYDTVINISYNDEKYTETVFVLLCIYKMISVKHLPRRGKNFKYIDKARIVIGYLSNNSEGYYPQFPIADAKLKRIMEILNYTKTN